MIPPAIPTDERQRIAALHALDVLDTAPEERFDRITRLTRALFGVPMAVLSLVDEDRQWFKSTQGLDATETPRDVSFCGHAILADEPFVVEDALQDARFADNPLVTGAPHIRFYAGQPLHATDGSRIGSLCILDRKPRTLDPEALQLLVDLGRICEQELTLAQWSNLDPLTHLPNRRGFEQRAARILAGCEGLCRSPMRQAMLVFLDLDGFKAINDRHGHAAGDLALADFAGVLNHGMRRGDLAGRLGGDEFVLLLPETDAVGTQALLSRLRALMDDHLHAAARPWRVAWSAGVVSVPAGEGLSLSEALAQADARMYEDKRARRDMVVTGAFG